MSHRNSSTGMSHGHDSFICVIREDDMWTCIIESRHLMSIDPHGMCSVLQCVAVCCSVLCCVAAVHIPHPMSIDPHGMWSVLQCVAVCRAVLQQYTFHIPCQLIHMECAVCCSVCCSVLCCVAAVHIPHPMSINPHGMWSVLQCVAVCCSVLCCVAAVYSTHPMSNNPHGMSDFR